MKIFKKVEDILSKAGIEEYKAEAKFIILNVSNQTLEEIISSDFVKNEKEILQIAKKRALSKAPIQQILGYSIFMDKKFIVNENVLIPRDETEILIKKAYELIKNKDNIDILDIGVGVGIISICLAKYLKNKNFEILSVDISTEALQVALQNILNHNLEKKVLIRKSDIYSKIRPNEVFDLIISNPPYIPYCEKENLDDTVKNFEPGIALFADEDGLEFYKKIIKDAKNHLRKEGIIAFELGINQAYEVKKLLEKDFTNIEITKDVVGIDRVITARLI